MRGLTSQASWIVVQPPLKVVCGIKDEEELTKGPLESIHLQMGGGRVFRARFHLN